MASFSKKPSDNVPPHQASLFGASLFEEPTIEQHIPIADGRLSLWQPLLSSEVADQLFKQLSDTLNWQQDELVIAGKTIPIPRLQAWYGDHESHYGYSGITLPPIPWTEALLHIKQQVEILTGHHFNSVLANYYRTGSDSVSWHQDNEAELGENPTIASVSLGQTRQFQLRHREQQHDTIKLNLPHNSLLLMAGELQRHWDHQLPKTKKAVRPRINLTFRLIKN